MKKFIYSIIFIILSLFIIGINYVKLNNKYILNKCSQIEYNYFNFNCKKYNVIITTGVREDDFDYDGISHNKRDYGIIKLNLNGFTDYAKNIEIILKINGKNNNYILEKNPFDNSFMCDIEKIIKIKDELKIFVNNVDDNFNKISPVSNNFKVNYKKALSLGYKELKTFIKQNKNCECYLTIETNNKNEYFWIFRVFVSNLNTKMVLVDTNNSEILLKN